MGGELAPGPGQRPDRDLLGQQQAGFLEGLAHGGQGQGPAAGLGNMGLEPGGDIGGQVGGEGRAEIAAVDASAGEDPEVGHEVVAAVALAHQDLRRLAVAAHDDQGGGVAWLHGARSLGAQASFGTPDRFGLAHETTV